MTSKTVGSRYLSGFNVLKIKMSDYDCGNLNDDIVKYLWVMAIQNPIDDWELIGGIEIESVDIGEDGVDRGVIHLQHGAEVYRIPFPFDRALRKAIIRSFIEYPRFFTT